MRLKLKWRADEDGPLQPEQFDNENLAKERARQLLNRYGNRITCEVWNEDETWQIVASPGLGDWCGKN